jgi:hypothetical protein
MVFRRTQIEKRSPLNTKYYEFVYWENINVMEETLY